MTVSAVSEPACRWCGLWTASPWLPGGTSSASKTPWPEPVAKKTRQTQEQIQTSKTMFTTTSRYVKRLDVINM